MGAISLGWRLDGTRIRHKVTGRTKTDVREILQPPKPEITLSATILPRAAVRDIEPEAAG